MERDSMAGENPHSERDLVWVVQLSSALSLGTLAAVIYSIRTISPSIQFQLSAATAAAFAVAAAGSWGFWHVVFRLNSEAGPAGQGRPGGATKTWLTVLATGLALALVLAFIYPLRNFPREKLSEIGFGSFVAIGFLAVLALLFWRVVRYLESD